MISLLRPLIILALALNLDSAFSASQRIASTDSTTETLDNFGDLDQQIGRVIDWVKESQYRIFLTPKQISTLNERDGLANFDQINAQLTQLFLDDKGGIDRSYSNNEFRNELSYRALEAISPLFAKSYLEINLGLKHLLKRYLLESENRTALGAMIQAALQYKFSPDELNRLALEGQATHQFISGGADAVILTGIAAALTPRTTQRRILDSLKRMFERRKMVHVDPEKAKELPLKDDELEKLRLFVERYNQSSLREVVPVGISRPSSSIEIARQLPKLRFLQKIGNPLSPGGVKALAAITGVYLAGGVGKTGLYQLAEKLFPANESNSTLNLRELVDEYFHGLSILKLECDVNSYLESLKNLDQKDLLAAFQRLSVLNSDFELLKRFDTTGPMYLEATALPSEILFIQPNVVQFSRLSKGIEINETFECPSFRGVRSPQIIVSLARVFANLKEAQNLLIPRYIESRKMEQPNSKSQN